MTTFNTLSVNNIAYHERVVPSLTAGNYDKGITRVVKAVLPLVALIPGAARYLQLAGGLKSLCDSQNIVKLTYNTTVLGAMYFNPQAVMLAQVAGELVTDAANATFCIRHDEFSSAASRLAHAAQKVFFIGAIVVGGPEIIAISLLAQVILGISRARSFYANGKYLEGNVEAIVSGVKAYGLARHVQTHEKALYATAQKLFDQASNMYAQYSHYLKLDGSNPLFQVASLDAVYASMDAKYIQLKKAYGKSHVNLERARQFVREYSQWTWDNWIKSFLYPIDTNNSERSENALTIAERLCDKAEAYYSANGINVPDDARETAGKIIWPGVSVWYESLLKKVFEDLKKID